MRLSELGYVPDDSRFDAQRLARKVIKACRYIPEAWGEEVEAVVWEVHRRHCPGGGDFEDGSGSQFSGDGDGEERVSGVIDRCLELLYGDSDDKAEALEGVLNLCREGSRNLEIVVRHHQLMSALSRLLSEDAAGSAEVCFGIGRVFLALSNFTEFHPDLSNYRVGSLIVDVLHLETRRAQRPREVEEGGAGGAEDKGRTAPRRRRHDQVVRICLSVLANLADDGEVQRKMLKKGMLGILSSCLDRRSVPCTITSLLILGKTSVFEETVADLSAEGCDVIPKLVHMIGSSNDDVIQSSLRVLYNLSFNRTCRSGMLESDALPKLFVLLRKSPLRGKTLRLLYHLSVDERCRKRMRNEDFLSILMQLIINFPRNHLAKELAAVAINVSFVPSLF